MSNPAANRIALVTGGGNGIGLAIARELARGGHTVVICGRSIDRLDAAAETAGVVPIACDVTEPTALDALLGEIDRRFGRLDLLVDNAGIQRNHDFVRATRFRGSRRRSWVDR